MAPDPVIATVHIDASPERVWAYFTQPEAIIRWMGEYALLEPQPGGHFTVDVKGAPVRGRFLRLDPPHRLLFSWGYAGSDRLPPGASTVEVRLTPDGAGTRVDLEHRDLPPAEQPGHATGWTHYLARLSAATVGDPGPDPGMGGTHLPRPTWVRRRAYPRQQARPSRPPGLRRWAVRQCRPALTGRPDAADAPDRALTSR